MKYFPICLFSMLMLILNLLISFATLEWGDGNGGCIGHCDESGIAKAQNEPNNPNKCGIAHRWLQANTLME
jgi:hypothetical protein